ncbi:MAG TPA: NAD-dependent epimerase/dehydratase family protein [Nitrosopumilaceae archaeon]|nr:NAD-dependent epimerase/dehydratase family protein [Nitrosopumilaceae archaeon]
MEKILVTGYDGFIGTHLVEDLSKRYHIIGLSKEKSKVNGIKQIKKDIRNLRSDQVPNNISYIIHLAAITDVIYCESNPAESFDVNVKGTKNILEIARKMDSKIIYLSTSHVYGIPKKLPIREDHSRNPTSIYSATKLASEILCESYSKSYGLDVTIIRPFSVYGPNSPSHLVTSRIITQLLTKNILSIGNLKPKRDFIYIDDLVSSIEIILKRASSFNVYNVGTGRSYSILELCKILKKISRRNLPIKSEKSISRKNEIIKIVSNSSKIRKLGWKPKVGIKEGLQLTFDWFKSQS